MPFQVSKLVSKYKQYNPNEKIVYTGLNAQYPEDQYELANISNYVQKLDFLRDSDIRNIIEWAGHRNSIKHFDNQYGNTNRWPVGRPQNLTKRVFSAGLSGKAAIRKLENLPGVGYQTASAIMTVRDPSNHAIIGPKRMRSLPIATNGINLNKDYERIRWSSGLEKYNQDSSVYDYYLNHVRDISSKTGNSAREIGMALWAYDEENKGQTF